MPYIYILELENNKYYIGSTYFSDPNIRFNQHISCKYNSAVWTCKYKPLKLLNFFNGDNFDEMKYTLIYMERYGIDNVRGGCFCKINLDENEKKVIEKMIFCANNKCYNCGSKNHFIYDCKKI